MDFIQKCQKCRQQIICLMDHYLRTNDATDGEWIARRANLTQTGNSRQNVVSLSKMDASHILTVICCWKQCYSCLLTSLTSIRVFHSPSSSSVTLLCALVIYKALFPTHLHRLQLPPEAYVQPTWRRQRSTAHAVLQRLLHCSGCFAVHRQVLK